MIVKRLIKTKAFSISIFLFGALSGSIHASEDTVHWDMNVGVSLLDFGYKEFDDNGVLLDREDGIIPGVIAGFGVGQRNWRIENNLFYKYGEVDYDGQTQSGIPLTTRTTEEIFDLEVQAEYWGIGSANQGIAIYTGTGYHYWGRDIKSGTASDGSPVTGFFETYEWWHVFVGAKGIYYHRARHSLGVDLRVSIMRNATLQVDLGSQKINLDLGEKPGWRLGFPWTYKVDSELSLVFEPYIERWELGRSNNVIVGPFIIWEPRSETRNYGMNFKVKVEF
ncbi:MAG: hypothetical protein BMS9Abin33_1117 [Gammaproteobacteria bacterium]|nr:MAG: hypothetical protein BMS9Abin33_1117 [Gammaproteobacteria bacterium]